MSFWVEEYKSKRESRVLYITNGLYPCSATGVGQFAAFWMHKYTLEQWKRNTQMNITIHHHLYHIDFISFNMKGPNVYTHAQP